MPPDQAGTRARIRGPPLDGPHLQNSMHSTTLEMRPQPCASSALQARILERHAAPEMPRPLLATCAAGGRGAGRGEACGARPRQQQRLAGRREQAQRAGGWPRNRGFAGTLGVGRGWANRQTKDPPAHRSHDAGHVAAVPVVVVVVAAVLWGHGHQVGSQVGVVPLQGSTGGRGQGPRQRKVRLRTSYKCQNRRSGRAAVANNGQGWRRQEGRRTAQAGLAGALRWRRAAPQQAGRPRRRPRQPGSGSAN